jgi:uncharacterized SAM-binding protein YcdF (DUF218 family)
VALSAAFAAFVAMSVAAVFVTGERYALDAPRSDAIVILSGNYVARGLFVGETRERTEAGLALALAGRAPIVAVTGGDVTAEKMAEELVTGGVPSEAVVIEREATSTLQNALYTRALLPRVQSVIVVTHRYHLPRAVASFRWAGFPEVHAHPADRTGRTDLRRAFSEGIKLPLNMARAAAFSALSFAGVPEARIAGLLA